MEREVPTIARSWRAAWDRVVPFFALFAEIRRAIYPTDAIESLNLTVRRAVRAHGHFPSNRSAAELVFLALLNVAGKIVVGRRMKCTGMRWSVVGANPVLWPRCACLGGWFESYWDDRVAKLFARERREQSLTYFLSYAPRQFSHWLYV